MPKRPSTSSGEIPVPPSEKRVELGREGIEALLKSLGIPPPSESGWERIERAFVHSSFRAENNLPADNERLEFLGDSVIGLVATQYLMEQFPDAAEGRLSKQRAAMVSRAVLGRIGFDLGIDGLIRLGAGEERTGGRQRSSIIGSALEALCGALYLTTPWNELNDALRQHVIIPSLEHSRGEDSGDSKSRLQEWSQKQDQTVPEYRVVQEGGPDHAKEFTVEVRLGERLLGTGTGTRIKLAENEAARVALEQLLRESPAPRDSRRRR